jgi:hypothetical protein
VRKRPTVDCIVSERLRILAEATFFQPLRYIVRHRLTSPGRALEAKFYVADK